MPKKSLFDKTDKKILKQISLDFEQAKESNAEKKQDWDKWWRRYLGPEGTRTQDETGTPLCSLVVPKAGEKVDWWTAKMLSTISNHRPIVNITSKEADKTTGARLLDEEIDYQLFKVENYRRKFSDQLKDSAVRGTGALKTFWDEENYQGSFDSVAREDFFIDPNARYVNEARFIIHRFKRTREQLEDSGLYDEKKLKKFFEYGDDKVAVKSQRVEQLSAENKSLIPSENKGNYEIKEYWTKKGVITTGLVVKEIGDEIYAQMFVLRKKKKVVVDDKGKGYLPFVAHISNPKPHMFDGQGLVEQMIELVEEYETKRRQMIDATNLSINKQAIVNENAFSPWTIEEMEMNTPGAMYVMEQNLPIANVYREIQKGDIPHSLLEELALLERDIQARTGIWEHVQGQETSRKETATTFIGMLQRAGMLFSSQFEAFGEDTLKELYKRLIWLNQQHHKKDFRSSKVVPKDMEGQTVSWSAELIKGKFDFELNISAVKGSNEMERAQLLELLKVYLSSQTFQALYPQVGVWLFKKILMTYDAVKNAEEAFKQDDMPPVNPNAQALMGGGMQGGGMPGGGGGMPPGFGPSRQGLGRMVGGLKP